MEDYNEYESYDPYDAMPFGDAQRFEENCLAAEQESLDEYYEEEDVDDEGYGEDLRDLMEGMVY